MKLRIVKEYYMYLTKLEICRMYLKEYYRYISWRKSEEKGRYPYWNIFQIKYDL